MIRGISPKIKSRNDEEEVGDQLFDEDDYAWHRERPTVQFLATPCGKLFEVQSQLKGVPLYTDQEDGCNVHGDRHGTPIETSRVHKLKNESIKNTEMWHMRFGCSAPSTLHKTQKCVDGMPPVLSNPPLFKCPFCEKGKLTKYQGGPRSTREVFLPCITWILVLYLLRQI